MAFPDPDGPPPPLSRGEWILTGVLIALNAVGALLSLVNVGTMIVTAIF